MTLEELFANNWQFANATQHAGATSHEPDLVTVSCCDARVPQDTIFGTAPGENFTVAQIGNVVETRDVNGESILSGSVLYPVEKTSPSAVIIVGHTDCGAVTAAFSQASEGTDPESAELQNELDLLIPTIREGLRIIDSDQFSADEQITRLVEYNVDRQVETLVDHDIDIPVVGVVCDLHGFYDGKPGQCHLINYEGARHHDEVPEEIRSNFQRHLVY
jgi:carbonic anhydrase